MRSEGRFDRGLRKTHTFELQPKTSHKRRLCFQPVPSVGEALTFSPS